MDWLYLGLAALLFAGLAGLAEASARLSAPNPGFARPPEGVPSSLGRPGERLEVKP